MRTELIVRFDYGSSIPWVTRHENRTLCAVSGPDMVVLRTPVPLRGEGRKTVGECLPVTRFPLSSPTEHPISSFQLKLIR